MSAQDTIRYFSYYLLALGVCVLLIPGIITAIIFLPPPADDDYVMIAFLVLVLAFYYRVMVRDRHVAFMQATVTARLGVTIAAVICVLLGWIAPNYLLVIAVDFAGALWTAQALRNEGVPAFRLV